MEPFYLKGIEVFDEWTLQFRSSLLRQTLTMSLSAGYWPLSFLISLCGASQVHPMCWLSHRPPHPETTSPVRSSQSRVLLPSQTCTLPWPGFCLMDAALQKPLGKPQEGEKEGKRRESAFQISSSFYYQLISVHLIIFQLLYLLCCVKLKPLRTCHRSTVSQWSIIEQGRVLPGCTGQHLKWGNSIPVSGVEE